ncbi:LysE family translocator [Streptomyces sp. NPDC001820]|uniref:LysE family translocator n=1 Tax=Streptomyces sp. NPDC001820 TaxID=3364613 RepID=UPI0036D0BC2F
MENSLVSFTGVAALLIVAPGVDFALVFHNALVTRRQGFATSLGVASGLMLHTALAVAGLSVLLSSEGALFVLYAVSGGYLVYLGVRGLAGLAGAARDPRNTAGADGTEPGKAPTGNNRTASAYRSGFLVNALNPKAPVLFLSIMPQFVPAESEQTQYTLLLGSIVVACALLWFPLVAFTAHRLGPLILRSKVRLAVECTTALVILSLGILQLSELTA